MHSRFLNSGLPILVVILALAWYYNYPKTLLKRPQSVHSWRQCDGASLALNYYQEGMQFFRPRTHGLYSDHYTTGYTSPSEIPILYFFVAFLYKVFGYHEYIFRATNLLIFFLGLFFLFRLAHAVLKDYFFAGAVMVLFFSSPLLVYYANNFMPNTVGLAFSIMGWYYFYRYSVNHSTRTYLTAVVFFLLAASMKITELTGPIIILMLLLMDRFRIVNLNLGTGKQLFLKISSLGIIFLVIAGWVFYAKWYNNLHGTSQFSTYTFPAWNINAEARSLVLHKMRVIWMTEYFLPFTLFCLPGFALLTIFFYKRADKVLGFASFLLLSGLIAYSILWFEALGDHDYFLIGFYILPVFVVINFFRMLLGFNIKKLRLRLLQLALIVFLAFNVQHARQRQDVRYYSWMNDYPEMQDLYGINPYLERLGINLRDTIVFFPSPNIRPLYLMNLKGWTIPDYSQNSSDIMVKDSIMMEDCIRKGAKYLFVNKTASLMKRGSLLPYTRDLYGKFGDILIFRIPPLENNYILKDSIGNLYEYRETYKKNN
jgi:hypothetical protein